MSGLSNPIPHELNYNKNNVGKFGRGIPKENCYRHDKFIQRFMLSARAVGSIIGRGGAKAKAIRNAVPDAKINIDGDNYPERIVTVTATSKDQVVQVSEHMCNNIWADFENEPQAKRPPRIMGKGQQRCTDEAIQVCLLVCELDCVAIIGQAGERLLRYMNDTGCQVYVHNEYVASGEYLPESNEKVVTVTGHASAIPVCLDMIFTNLVNEAQTPNMPAYKIRPWIMEKAGPCGFYGHHATWHGDGLENFPNFNGGRGLNGQMNTSQLGPAGKIQGGKAVEQTGLLARPVPGLDPMIQKLDVEYLPDGTISIFANIDHCGTIMGQSGSRIKEIRRMSGANIKICDLVGDSCLREITINRGNAPNGDVAIQNAIWLMNICLNAFTDVNASACPWAVPTTLQEVVLSELYGKPPGMSMGAGSEPIVPVTQPAQPSNIPMEPLPAAQPPIGYQQSNYSNYQQPVGGSSYNFDQTFNETYGYNQNFSGY